MGAMRGRERDGCTQFLGIRYAHPTGGERRFLPPMPVEPWDGIYDATQFGTAAPQAPRAADSVLPKRDLHWDEDCLFLNVYTPAADDAGRPVLFWIHGGSYLNGSGDQYDGSPFANNGDLVVVTINYRLGALGFAELGHLDPTFTGSHNNGIRDMIEALSWVSHNISSFGGDPDRVTICGESAGAGAVNALLASPAAAGLFHQAISESAPARLGHSETTFADRLLDELSPSDRTEPIGIETLLKAPAEQILRAQAAVLEQSAADLGVALIPADRPGFRPVIDTITVTESPGSAAGSHPVPLLIGTNLDEGTLFSLHYPAEIDDDLLRRAIDTGGHDADRVVAAFRSDYPQDTNRQLLIHMLGDSLFRTGSLAVADAQVATDTPVWVYLFTWQSQGFNGAFGAMHALEIPFVWNMPLEPWQALLGEGQPWPAGLSDQMHRAWISFVHTGNPNHDDIPDWPRYDTERRPTMEFGDVSSVVADPHGMTRASWLDQRY